MNSKSILNKNKLILAPMQAVNCTAFRLLCKKYGAGWVYSPMIVADSVVALSKQLGEKEAVKKLVNPLKIESPFSIQYTGKDLEKMKLAAEILSKHADFLDLNCGCPSPTMTNCNSGGYYSRDLGNLKKAISAMLDGSKVPVTAKIRIGWDENHINAVEACKMLEELGVDSVAIHGRTVLQGRRNGHRWDIIRDCKEAVNIPIIANGNVTDANSVVTCLEETKADGIMIGRAAQDNPFIFTEGNRILKEGVKDFVERKPDNKKLFFEFLELYKKHEAEYSFPEIRDHAQWFSKGILNSSKLRPLLVKSRTEEELLDLVERFF